MMPSRYSNQLVRTTGSEAAQNLRVLGRDTSEIVTVDVATSTTSDVCFYMKKDTCTIGLQNYSVNTILAHTPDRAMTIALTPAAFNGPPRYLSQARADVTCAFTTGTRASQWSLASCSHALNESPQVLLHAAAPDHVKTHSPPIYH